MFGVVNEPAGVVTKPVKAAANQPVPRAATAEGKVERTLRPKVVGSAGKKGKTVAPRAATRLGRKKR